LPCPSDILFHIPYEKTVVCLSLYIHYPRDNILTNLNINVLTMLYGKCQYSQSLLPLIGPLKDPSPLYHGDSYQISLKTAFCLLKEKVDGRTTRHGIAQSQKDTRVTKTELINVCCHELQKRYYMIHRNVIIIKTKQSYSKLDKIPRSMYHLIKLTYNILYCLNRLMFTELTINYTRSGVTYLQLIEQIIKCGQVNRIRSSMPTK